MQLQAGTGCCSERTAPRKLQTWAKPAFQRKFFQRKFAAIILRLYILLFYIFRLKDKPTNIKQKLKGCCSGESLAQDIANLGKANFLEEVLFYEIRLELDIVNCAKF